MLGTTVKKYDYTLYNPREHTITDKPLLFIVQFVGSRDV
jgi:hypothetical protein